jgi:heme/copper-type cytochrome/quinol oxidase subunit 2
MTETQSQDAINALAGAGIVFGVISLVVLIFFIILYWRIFSKAGYSGAMSLWMLVPIANLVVIIILAFGEWPMLRELKELRQRVGSQPPYNQPGGPQGPGYPSGPGYPGGPGSGYPGGSGYPSGPGYPQQ